MNLSSVTETFGNQDHSWLASAEGTQSQRSCTIAVASLTEGTHYPDGYIPDGTPVALATSGTYSGKAVPMGARANEAQTVTITGTPTGGTFTLTFDGETTAAIAYNAAASAVQTALEGLSNVTAGDVAVTGGPGPGTPYVVTFSGGDEAGTNVPQMTASGASLTGGSSPAVAVTTTTAGGPGQTDGSDTLWGFLYMPIAVPTGAANVHGSVLIRGVIDYSELPLALTAAQRATNNHFIWV
jgi:hypothetical protein